VRLAVVGLTLELAVYPTREVFHPSNPMNVLWCVLVAALALAAASATATTNKETGVRARHMLALGDESILLARGSLRSAA
jgi:hypothetical protein